jgi:Domain of unknown function (DUF4160)
MPIVVRLQYCVIRMYFNDHNPPHFHVDTTDGRALVAIADGTLIEGRASARAMREARDWAEVNRDKLFAIWAENH